MTLTASTSSVYKECAVGSSDFRREKTCFSLVYLQHSRQFGDKQFVVFLSPTKVYQALARRFAGIRTETTCASMEVLRYQYIRSERRYSFDETVGVLNRKRWRHAYPNAQARCFQFT